MLNVEDPILVLHSAPRSLNGDSGCLHLINMTKEDSVALKLSLSSSWMMGDHTITVQILSEQKFANSYVDGYQDPSKFASLDVNLTVRWNIVEVGEFESRLHYLLGIEQSASQLI